MKTELTKIIKFFLFAIIGILFGCNTKNNNQEVFKKDYTKLIDEKSNFTKKNQLENCNCEENTELKDYISCKETVFSNGAKIYRQFNCDSSWLVFENKNHKKNLYSLDKNLIELTSKLGYGDWKEFENSILIEEKLAAGTDAQYNYVVLNKENGEIIKKLGSELYRNENKDFPFFVSIDSDNPTDIKFYNFSNNKSYKFPFTNKKFQKTLSIDVFRFHPEYLFEQGSFDNGIFKIKFKYKLREKDNFKYEKIIINLNEVDFN